MYNTYDCIFCILSIYIKRQLTQRTHAGRKGTSPRKRQQGPWMLWRCKSTNRQKYAKEKVCMQINMHVCNLTHTHTVGHHVTFHAKPQGTRPCGLVSRPEHLMGIPSLNTINQLPHKSNLISALKRSSRITKASPSGRGIRRGAHASKRVPTQFDILSNDRHGRWHEMHTHVPRASQACVPVTRCTGALLAGFWVHLQDYSPWGRTPGEHFPLPIISYYLDSTPPGRNDNWRRLHFSLWEIINQI